MTLAGSSATGPAATRSGPPATSVGGVGQVRLGPAAAGRCRRRVHLDSDGNAPAAARAPLDDGLRLRLAAGDAHRTAVLAAIGAATTAVDAVGDRFRWDPSGTDRPAVLVEPSLRSENRFGTPDLLLWTGDGYQSVIVRSHRTTDPGSGALTSPVSDPLQVGVDAGRKARAHPADALALAHHHRLLQDLGLASSVARGGVIGLGGPGGGDSTVVLWHRLDVADSSVLADYDRRFADRLAVATAAATGAPALALPSRIGECRRCSWWPVCSADLEAGKDISLIFAGGDVDVLHGAGVRTVDDLAALDAEVARALPLTGVAAGTARVRARAFLAGWRLVRKAEQVTVRRADLELDVDMESFLEDGAYLWGTYLTGPAVEDLGLTTGYRAFVSWSPLPDRDEGRAFAEFWRYLSDLREIAAARGLTFAAYCYSRSAEERWLRSTPLRYAQVPGMPTSEQISEFCSSPEWVDIYQEIRDQFVVPGSMKLKVLAPVAGFHWRDPEPGGENSMAWYRQAVGGVSGGSSSCTGPVEPVDRAMSERILRYNEDDVLATLALRRWMTQRAGQVPTVSELEAD
jgi:predicted RecB family nuclease